MLTFKTNSQSFVILISILFLNSMMAQGPLYFYGDCDEIEERGFVTCDIESVLDGASFNLPYVLDGGFGSGDFNDWLCTGGIWFSTWGWYGFIAGESDISIQVEFTNCINIGNEYGGFVILQQGCQGGECLSLIHI